MVAGKRVKTIDVHAHCLFHEALDLLRAGRPPAETAPRPVLGAEEAFLEINQGLPRWISQAVDMEILSINPIWYHRERDLAAQVVKLQNEKLAELCAQAGPGSPPSPRLTLQAPDLAVQELETAVKKQGLKGAAIGGSVDGVAFSDPKFNPVWAKAEELGVPLFIHPYGIPELDKRAAGNGWLTNAAVFPMETTLALSHMIFEGTFDRFPEAEGDRGPWRRLSAVLCRPLRSRLPGQPGQLRPESSCRRSRPNISGRSISISLVFTPEAIRHLAAQVGAGQIVLGSDYPYRWQLRAGRPHLRLHLA